MKQKVVLIVSILVGALAFLATRAYLQGEHRKLAQLREEIYKGARKISVVAAARDIPRGTVIGPEDIGQKMVFEAAAHDRVITLDKAEMILNKKALFEIKKMKPVLWSDIEGAVPIDLGLAPAIKPGMRAISLSVGGAAAVSGMIAPNDRIDVLGTFNLPSRTVPGELETVTLTVLQDVTVLATGQELAKQRFYVARSRRSGSYSTVTVEVTPREAELLVFAQQSKGRLTLSLRNPGDVSFEDDLPEINFKHLAEELPELNSYRQKHIRHKRDL